MTKFSWQSHLNWFVPFISELYPLTKFQLIRYEDILDWKRIIRNDFIKWTDETLECFNDRLQSVEKTNHILFEMDDMQVTSCYQPHDYKIYREDKVDYFSWWKQIDFGIYKLPEQFDEEKVMMVLESFDGGIDLATDPFDCLPIPTRFLRERKDTLPWDLLSRYWGLQWSIELLKEFEDYWVADKLIENHTVFNYCLKDDLNDEFIDQILS